MKQTVTLQMACLFIFSSFIITSCEPSYQFFNQPELVKKYGYASGKMPFKLNGSNFSSFLPEKKGQWMLSLHLLTGAELNSGVAVSKSCALYLKAMGQQGIHKSSMDPVHIVYQSSNSNDTIIRKEGVAKEAKFYKVAGEIGFGKYGLSKNKKFRWESSVGMAYGFDESLYSYYYPGLGYYDLHEDRNFIQSFVQFNEGYFQKHFEVVATGRVEVYHFYNQKFSKQTDYEYLDYYKSAKANVAMEAGIKIGTGGDRVRVFGQMEFAAPVIGSGFKIYPVNGNIGIMFRFGNGKKKTSTT